LCHLAQLGGEGGQLLGLAMASDGQPGIGFPVQAGRVEWRFADGGGWFKPATWLFVHILPLKG
jgi:hypothetical protein